MATKVSFKAALWVGTLGLGLGLGLGLRPALADCESGITALARVLAQVSDEHTKALLQTDLRRAQVDLWEFDEVECAMVLDHSARLLAAGKGAAN